MTISEERRERRHEFLSQLRAQWLTLEGDDLEDIHGWLVGVACAIERKRGSDPGEMDKLIAELRQSRGPEDYEYQR
jgi:hypothetical protein